MYKPELLEKPAVLALNKIDIDGADEKVQAVLEQMKNIQGIVDLLVLLAK